MRSLVFCGVLVWMMVLAASAGAITFDDGLVHVIDAENSFPFDEVIVEDGPGGAVTTLEVVLGGQIGTGGIPGAGGVIARGHSIVNMSGGTIGEAAFSLEDDAVANISGGTIGDEVGTGGIFTSGNSVANISGGTISVIICEDNSVVNVSGDTFVYSAATYDSCVFNLSDGIVEFALNLHGGRATMNARSLTKAARFSTPTGTPGRRPALA